MLINFSDLQISLGPIISSGWWLGETVIFPGDPSCWHFLLKETYDSIQQRYNGKWE